MGSSCFARENKENLELIQEFIKNNNLEDRVEIEGTLCINKCETGPNICIDDNWYSKVTPVILLDILKETLN